MTASRGLALFLSVGVAGAFAHAAGPGPASSTTAVARLTAISSRTHVKGASLVIEASQPVAYVATRPDALTVVIDFRNVGADGVANSVIANANSPIAAVSVEPSEALGAPASRVRIRLAQPVVHRVRSERNTIVVDFEKPSANAPPYVTASAVRPTAPDAMKALELPFADPIVAMRLDTPSAPQAILVAAAVAAPSPVPAIVVAASRPAPAVVAAAPSPAPALDRAPTPASLAPPAALQAPPPPQPPQPPAAEQPGAARTPVRFTGHPV